MGFIVESFFDASIRVEKEIEAMKKELTALRAVAEAATWVCTKPEREGRLHSLQQALAEWREIKK